MWQCLWQASYSEAKGKSRKCGLKDMTKGKVKTHPRHQAMWYGKLYLRTDAAAIFICQLLITDTDPRGWWMSGYEEASILFSESPAARLPRTSCWEENLMAKWWGWPEFQDTILLNCSWSVQAAHCLVLWMGWLVTWSLCCCWYWPDGPRIMNVAGPFGRACWF